MARRTRVYGVLLVLVFSAVSLSAQLRIRFTADTMRFGDIGPCLGARDSFEIINTGTRVVPSPGTRIIPGFRVEAENDNNILPGESRTIYVTFIGNAVVQSYAEVYDVTVRIQGEVSSDSLWIFARRAAGRCCVFRIDTIRGFAGDQVEIRVIQDSTASGVFLADVSSTMNVRYDPTTVVPTGTSPEVIAQKTGEVTFSVRLRNDNGVLASIPARLTLGTSINSEARIAWHSNSDIRVIDTTYAGPVELLGVCRDSGERLFDPQAALPLIWVWQRVLCIERVSTTSPDVHVYDVQGRCLFTVPPSSAGTTRLPLDSGVYLVRCGTKTTRVVSQ